MLPKKTPKKEKLDISKRCTWEFLFKPKTINPFLSFSAASINAVLKYFEKFVFLNVFQKSWGHNGDQYKIKPQWKKAIESFIYFRTFIKFTQISLEYRHLWISTG